MFHFIALKSKKTIKIYSTIANDNKIIFAKEEDQRYLIFINIIT
jgi:hypothetical protein